MKSWILGIILIMSFSSPAWAAPSIEDCSPSLQETQEKTLRYAGYERRDMERWRHRVRWAAALPRVQFGFDRDLKDVSRLSTKDNISISGGDVTIGPQEKDFNEDFNSGTSFEVKATWDLSELIFNRDEMNVSTVARGWVRERNMLLNDVELTYFERRELFHALTRSQFPEKRHAFRMQLERLTGHLDGLTGGWFSRQCGGAL
jgi:hypothetical protein